MGARIFSHRCLRRSQRTRMPMPEFLPRRLDLAITSLRARGRGGVDAGRPQAGRRRGRKCRLFRRICGRHFRIAFAPGASTREDARPPLRFARWGPAGDAPCATAEEALMAGKLRFPAPMHRKGGSAGADLRQRCITSDPTPELTHLAAPPPGASIPAKSTPCAPPSPKVSPTHSPEEAIDFKCSLSHSP